MSKRLVFSMICLTACFSIGTWAAYRFVFAPTPSPEVMEHVEPMEEISADSGTVRERRPCNEDLQHVSFQGVSFDFDRCAFGDVTAEKIPDSKLDHPDYKPDGVAPEHLRFEFSSGPRGWAPFVEVYPVQRFPSMYAVNKRLARNMEKEIRNLKRVIKQPTLRFDNQIPYLPFVDAGQDFQAKVKSRSFDGGSGVFFATYLDTEVILINNDHLRYIFEGITADGKYYVLGEIPISLPFLEDVTQNVESASLYGFTYDDLMEMLRTDEKDRKTPKYIELEKRYDAYISGVTYRVETTKPEEFEPDLRKLENLIASLRIKK